MAKRITDEQVIQKGIFNDAIESAKKLTEVLNVVEGDLKDILKTSSELANKNPLKGYKDVNKVLSSLDKAEKTVKELNVVEKERERLLKEQAKLNAKLAQSTSAVAQKNAELRLEVQQQTKINKELAREKLGLVSLYEKESRKLNDLRKKYKDVALSQGETSKEARRLLKSVTALDNKLKRVDANVGQFQRNVGNYASAFRSLTNIISAAGVTLGAAGAFRVLRNGITIVRDFQKENAVLAGVLNKTRQEINVLTEDAIRLGSTTAKTAQEVTQLQIAYARLGFTQSEIIDLTGDTIDGSIALNAQLDETAELTGAVIKTFDDLNTTDAGSTLDKLTLSTQKSALNFSKLQTALPIVGGAANAAGVSFERTLAILGKLSDSGIDASSSATALRNIFIESAKQGLNYEEILEQIANSQDKLTAANDEFGKRAAVSSVVLSKNLEATKELSDVLENDFAGVASKVAAEQLNTLDGAVKLLTSAWEGYLISLNEGDQVTSKLSAGLRFLAKNLGTIIRILAALTAGFIAYKTAIVASNLALRAYTLGQRAAAAAQSLFSKGTKVATISMKAFNTAVKSNPVGLLASALAAAVTLIIAFWKETDNATDSQSDFNDQLERTQDILSETRSTQDLINALGELNRTQTESLKSRIEANLALLDIQESQQKSIKINSDEGKSLKGITELIELRTKARNEATGVEKDAIDVELQSLNQLKERIEGDLDSRLRREIGLNSEQLETQIEINKRNLALIEARIKLFKEQGEGDSKQEGLIANVNEKIKEQNKLLLEAQSIPEIRRIQGRIKALEEEKEALLGVVDAEKDVKSMRQVGFDILQKQEDEAEERRIKRKELALSIIERQEREAAQRRAEIIRNGAEVIGTILDKQNKERQQALDKEIQANENQVSRLQMLADKRVLNVEESLAFEAAQADKLAREKEKAQQREAQTELIKTGLTLYASKIEAGEKNAVGSTLADITLLTSAIKALPAFYEGIEDTGSGGNVDNKGGFLSILHKRERVMPEKDNIKTTGISNEVLGNLGYLYKKGMIEVKGSTMITKVDGIDTMISILRELPQDNNANVDMITGLIKLSTKRQGVINNIYKKISL